MAAVSGAGAACGGAGAASGAPVAVVPGAGAACGGAAGAAGAPGAAGGVLNMNHILRMPGIGLAHALGLNAAL